MYNEDVKQSFIADYGRSDKSRVFLRYIFRGIKSIEEQYGVDFYAMNEQQAQEALNNISGTRVTTAGTCIILLRSYVKWCRAKGYAVSNAVSSLRIDLYDRVKETTVASPYHLKLSLDAAFPHPEKSESRYIYRTFLWLAYMGFTDEEAIHITDKEVLFDKRVICREGENVFHRIYPESELDIKKACDMKEMLEDRGKDGFRKKRADGNYILRGRANDYSENSMEELLEKTLRPIVSRSFKKAAKAFETNDQQIPSELSLKLSYKTVFLSGVFYRAYERERIGIASRIPFTPRFDEIVLKDRTNAPDEKFYRNYTRAKWINPLVKQMEADYENWKSVHT